jgi:hypothetical protein
MQLTPGAIHVAMRHPKATSHANPISHSNTTLLHRTPVLTTTARRAKYRDDSQTGIHSPRRANDLCCGTLPSCIEDQKMLVNQFAGACTTVLTLAGLACECKPAQSQTDADRISRLERHLEQSNPDGDGRIARTVGRSGSPDEVLP